MLSIRLQPPWGLVNLTPAQYIIGTNNYSKKSGIPIHGHLLRHSHATELIKTGWDASYVQKRLGHAQVQTTINTYVHLDDEDLSKKWQAYQKEKQQRGKSTTTQAAISEEMDESTGEHLEDPSGREKPDASP